MTSDEFVIVKARVEHLEQLPPIELEAAQLLVGHAPETVLNETSTVEQLCQALSQGHLWVALKCGTPVGFAQIRSLEPGTIHLEEIDVLPAYGRRGIGRALVEAVCTSAAENSYVSISLTTFRDVIWNMPFYAKLGFVEIPPQQLSPALLEVLEEEHRKGLLRESRVAMKRVLIETVSPSHPRTTS